MVEGEAQRRPRPIGGLYLPCDKIAAEGMASVHLGRLFGPAGVSRAVAIARLNADCYCSRHSSQHSGRDGLSTNCRRKARYGITTHKPAPTAPKQIGLTGSKPLPSCKPPYTTGPDVKKFKRECLR